MFSNTDDFPITAPVGAGDDGDGRSIINHLLQKHFKKVKFEV